MSTTINTVGFAGGPVAASDGLTLNEQMVFWVPPDGSAVAQEGYWGPSRALFVQNFSATQNLLVSLDTLYNFTILPGNAQIFNIPFTKCTAKYAAANAGNAAAITLFSDPQNNQNALQNIQIIGSVTASIVGTVTAIISGTVNVSVQNSSINVAANITNSAVNVAITSSGTLPVQLNASSITLSTSDTIVENNTGTLLGLLASSSSVFTLIPFTQNQSVIAKAIASFALTAFVVGAGRLNVWYVANSETQWLLKDVPFYASPIVSVPLEKRFNTPLSAGASLFTRWDDATADASFVLSQ